MKISIKFNGGFNNNYADYFFKVFKYQTLIEQFGKTISSLDMHLTFNGNLENRKKNERQ